jgi:hypothetical protein
MKPRHVSFLVATILPLFTGFVLPACDLAGPEARQANVTTTTGALKQGGERPAEQIDATPGAAKDGPQIADLAGPCECTKTFMDGSTRTASSCNPTECADQQELEDCEDGTSTDCNHLRSCSCYCEGTPVEEFQHDPSDGVYLSGVPELWQFNYGCNTGGANAVGCGPVALASMFYWWAQRGYPHLVEDHLTSGGLQDWQSLVRELRDDYADDGVCIPDNPFTPGSQSQYLVTQDEMEKELKDYVDDHGYFGYVSQYRVCTGCTDRDNERSRSSGLAIIQAELEAGRPLVLGYAAGRAERSSVLVDGETIFTGELSNAAGWINHYAVITGHRRTSDGRDIIYINKGWETRAAGVALEWNPAGKWTHLFTLSISLSDADRAAEFCTLDEELSGTFSSTTDVEVSHGDRNTASATREFTVMAGSACGRARDGYYEPVTPWWRTTDYCPLRALVDYTGDVGAAGPLDDGNQPLDQLGPR